MKPSNFASILRSYYRTMALLLVLLLTGCGEQFTTADQVGGQGGELVSGGQPETGGAASGGQLSTGGAESTGGAAQSGGAPATGGAEATGGSESTCSEAFVCSYETKLGDVVSAHGKNWECQTPEYCISCGVYPECAPGEYHSVGQWQCETAWVDLGACE